MAESFIRILRLTLQKPDVLPPDRRLLVAVSGGVDSVVLLHALCSLRHELDLALVAATLDHGIRPQGQADAAWVKALAEDWHVPAVMVSINVPALAAADGTSLETAARRHRYRFLAQAAVQHSCSSIATAHHANDQAETVLMHLIRGAGVQGLAGMALVSALPEAPALTLIRPMLGIRRDDVLAYCRAHRLSFREDHTNADTRYFRNAVRHEVLPVLQSFNPQLVDALARLADSVRTDLDFIDASLGAQLETYTAYHDDGTVSLDFSRWQMAHEALQRRWIRAVHQHLAPQHQLNAEHVGAALALLSSGKVDKFATLPGLVRLGVRHDTGPDRQIVARISPRQKIAFLQHPPDVAVTLSAEPVVMGNRRLSLVERPDARTIALVVARESQIGVRRRRSGDRWQPPGLRGRHQKLNEWFVDHKVPREHRDTVPLLIVDDQIAAVILPLHWFVAAPFQPSSSDVPPDGVIRYVLIQDS
jgi:tRNA(Ile)-lysidine synthase